MFCHIALPFLFAPLALTCSATVGEDIGAVPRLSSAGSCPLAQPAGTRIRTSDAASAQRSSVTPARLPQPGAGARAVLIVPTTLGQHLWPLCVLPLTFLKRRGWWSCQMSFNLDLSYFSSCCFRLCALGRSPTEGHRVLGGSCREAPGGLVQRWQLGSLERGGVCQVSP